MLLKKKLVNYSVLLSLSVLLVIFGGLWLRLKPKVNYMANDAVIIANTLFSETKDIEDAKRIASVIQNRTAKPERFGATPIEVIYKPYQFSGVNSPEWKKAEARKFNEEEAQIYKQMLQIGYQMTQGKFKSVTEADHYFNPKITKPKWAAKMKKLEENKNHSYYKE
jgi:hypothetical protein